MLGEMLWFNKDKNFGFIRTDDGERLYVHESGFQDGQVPDGRCAGTRVSFERQEYGGPEGGAQALAVTPLVDLPAGRARRRHQQHRSR